MPSYKIMEEKDISFRTGYNRSDPINKRFTYRVLVSPKIKRNQIEPLFNQLIEEFTSIDKDIDDITIWLYSNEKLVIYDVAMATWAPEDGNVTGEIAVTNNRDSYKLKITISENLEKNLTSIDIDNLSEKIDGELIGKWKELSLNEVLIIFKKNGKIYLRAIQEGCKPLNDELIQRKSSKGVRYDYKKGGYFGEYFILNKNNELELYDRLNNRFTTALPR